jgi:hypothetical protein
VITGKVSALKVGEQEVDEDGWPSCRILGGRLLGAAARGPGFH